MAKTKDPFESADNAKLTLQRIQADEKEVRELSVEQKKINYEKGGHWDEQGKRIFEDKPRYQSDMIWPVINAVSGELENYEFNGVVSPAGSEASEPIADKYEKMLRSIQNF